MKFEVQIAGTNGCAFHVGSLTAQSHGCVHLSEEVAIIIYNQAKDGTKVIVYLIITYKKENIDINQYECYNKT